jgi:hypothetical protein
MSLVITVLARQAARKTVKRQFQAQGLKVSHIQARVITATADDYLRDHPELIAQAAEAVRKVPQLRTLAERQRLGDRRPR